MYQHSSRSKSHGATFISPTNRHSPLLNHNSASSLTSSASFNQNYNAPYQSYGHVTNYRAMPRSVSNPPSPAQLRPHSLYSLSVMPPVNRNNRTSSYEDHSRSSVMFPTNPTAASYSSQPPSPIVRSPSESAFETASLTSHDRRLSISGVSDGVSSFAKPDRYHRRRKTGESTSNVSTAATSVASSPSPEVKSAPVNVTPKLSTLTKQKTLDVSESSIYKKNIKASQSTPTLSRPLSIHSEGEQENRQLGARDSNFAAPQYIRPNVRERPYNQSRRHSSFAEENAISTLQLPSDSRRKSYLMNQSMENKLAAVKDSSSRSSHRRTSSSPNQKVTAILDKAPTAPVEKAPQSHSVKSDVSLSKKLEKTTSKTGPPIKDTLRIVEKPIKIETYGKKEVSTAAVSTTPVPLVKRPSSAGTSLTRTPVSSSEISPTAVSPTAAFSTVAQPIKTEKEKSSSLSSKLKKAFSFAPKQKETTFTPPFDALKKKRSFSSLGAFRRNSDTKSIYSIKSNMSTSSFATLKKFGSSIAKSFSRNTDSNIPVSERSLLASTADPVVTHVVVEAEIMKSSVPLTTTVEEISAEAERSLNDSAERVTDDKNESRVASPEAIPSLTSSSASDTIENSTPLESDPKLEESMVEGDTIFPKSLDLLTVNTIRSSLDRVKSLERKRSRRANSMKKEAEEAVPNETTVHVHKDPTAVDPPADASAPRSILKSATGSIRSISSSRSFEKNDEKETERTRSLSPSDIDLTTLVQIQSDNFLDLEQELESFEASSFNHNVPEIAINKREIEKTSESAEENIVIYQESIHDDEDENSKDPFVDAKDAIREAMEIDEQKQSGEEEVIYSDARESQIGELNESEQQQQLENESRIVETSDMESGPDYEDPLTSPVSQQPAEFAVPPKESHRKRREHVQYHYHPIYQQRMLAKGRAFQETDEHRRTPSFASSSSSSAGRYSTPQRHSTDCDEESLKTPVSQAKSNFVSFSSRISIYDTYGRGDYDRRPDLATCNRLTPVLAQRIKEEINTFKMEMEVHNDSRRYTHFL